MKRRDFSKMAGMGLLTMHSFPSVATTLFPKHESMEASNVPIGVAIHALRGMGVKVFQLVQYAIEHKLDSVLLGDFYNQFESLEDMHLAEVGNLAKANDVSIYVGAFSISKTSSSYRAGFINAEARLKECIRVASVLGSPIVATRIGSLRERYSAGGMEVHIKEVIRVMKALRGPALDAGLSLPLRIMGN